MGALFIGLIAFGILDGFYYFKVARPKKLRNEALDRFFYAAIAAANDVGPILAKANDLKYGIREFRNANTRSLRITFRGIDTDDPRLIIYYVSVRWVDGRAQIQVDRPRAHQPVPTFLDAMTKRILSQQKSAD